jgi:hypothetical protein
LCGHACANKLLQNPNIACVRNSGNALNGEGKFFEQVVRHEASRIVYAEVLLLHSIAMIQISRMFPVIHAGTASAPDDDDQDDDC